MISTRKKKKIGDVCEILNGFAFKSEEYVDNGIRIIRITNVQKGFIVDFDPKFYSFEAKDQYSQYLLNERDLLISLTGNVGRVGLISADFLPAFLNQRVACIRPLNDMIINKKYLFHYLDNNNFERDCINSSRGIAQKNMSTEWLKKYYILLPSLEEQEKIAAILDKVSNLISLRKQQIEKLDLLVKSRFIEMFGDMVINPKKWELGIIRDVVREVKYGTIRPAIEKGKYKYLRMNNITYDGHLNLSSLKYIDIPDNEVEKCIVYKGDVLFNRTNSKELVGKTCVYNLDESMIIAGYIIRIRVNEKVTPIYLSSVLNSKYGKSTLFEMCKAIVGQANINAQELQNIKILIPPIELQNQFSNFVQQVEKQKLIVQQGLDKLELLKKALMQEYFG